MPQRHILNNPHDEFHLFSRRIVLFAFGLLALLFILCARLFLLQAIQNEKYTTLSRENRLLLMPIAPNRGLIYDRHGVIIAQNNPIFSLILTPTHVKHIKSTLHELKKILTISPVEEQNFYKQFRHHRHTQPVTLKLRLTPVDVARFSVNRYRFPGVQIRAGLLRHYPLADTTAHIVGYVSRINTKELDRLDKTNYSGTDYIGKVGIEKSYETALHGEVGYQEVEVDATGRIVRTLKRVNPKPGANLYLTIDSKLQKIAADAMQGTQGAVVAIIPQTGEILALYSAPSYDPNRFVNTLSQHDYAQLIQSPARPLYNRTIRGQYPFGSTIKPFIALKALDEHVITEKDRIYDPGWFKIKNSRHLYHDWNRVGHGWVNLKNAIIESCDTYFYHLATKLHIQTIDAVLNQFGFGQLSGIEMQEELPGLVASPHWKQFTKGKPWYPGDTLNSVIGQGFMLTTPIQLANATATLAMRGKNFHPHLLYQHQTTDGIIHKTLPALDDTIDFKAHTWNAVINAMRGVIKNTHGSGHRYGRHVPYTIAAKTGTAQIFSLLKNQIYHENEIPLRLRDHSLFIAFAPYKHPLIAVTIVVEHSKAAPVVARKLIDYYLLTEKHLAQRPTRTPHA